MQVTFLEDITKLLSVKFRNPHCGACKLDQSLPFGGILAWASVQFSSVQSLSRVWLFETPWIAARQASLSITVSRSSLRLTSIESVMPSSHLILCHPLLLSPIPPSIRIFSNESTLHIKWPKYWSFSFSFIPSKEIPGLISFRMDWLDLLAVQGTLKSLLQHHSSKASILWGWTLPKHAPLQKCGLLWQRTKFYWFLLCVFPISLISFFGLYFLPSSKFSLMFFF